MSADCVLKGFATDISIDAFFCFRCLRDATRKTRYLSDGSKLLYGELSSFRSSIFAYVLYIRVSVLYSSSINPVKGARVAARDMMLYKVKYFRAVRA